MTKKPEAELLAHISDQQSVACRLAALLEAAAVLNNEGNCPGGVYVLIETCAEIAAKLNHQLDSVSLPEVAA